MGDVASESLFSWSLGSGSCSGSGSLGEFVLSLESPVGMRLMGEALVALVCFFRWSGAMLLSPEVWAGVKQRGKGLTFWLVMFGLAMRSGVLRPDVGMSIMGFGVPDRRSGVRGRRVFKVRF